MSDYYYSSGSSNSYGNSYNSGYSSSSSTYHHPSSSSSSSSNYSNNYNNGDDGMDMVFWVIAIFVALAMSICKAAGRESRQQRQQTLQLQQQRHGQRARYWQHLEQTNNRGCSAVVATRASSSSSCGGGGSGGSTANKEYWTPVTEQKLTGIHATWSTLQREFERKAGRAVENVTHELMQQEHTTTNSSSEQQDSPKDGLYNVTYKIQQNGGGTVAGNSLENTLTVQFQMKLLFGMTNRGGWGIIGVGQSNKGSKYHGLMTTSGNFFLMEDTQGRHPTIKIISVLEGRYNFATSSVGNAKWSSIHGDRNVATTITLDAQTVPIVAPATVTDEVTGMTVDLSTLNDEDNNDNGGDTPPSNNADVVSLPVVEAQPVPDAAGSGGGRATVVVESSLMRSIV